MLLGFSRVLHPKNRYSRLLMKNNIVAQKPLPFDAILNRRQKIRLKMRMETKSTSVNMAMP
jgi:hypothetical protein